MQQILSFPKPIPSAKLHAMRYNTKTQQWRFEYAVDTPVELTNNMKEPLYVYSHVHKLKLVAKGSIGKGCNIEVSSLEDYRTLLEKLRAADMQFRKSYLEEHPEKVGMENTVKITNADHEADEIPLKYHLVAGVVHQDDTHTVISGA